MWLAPWKGTLISYLNFEEGFMSIQQNKLSQSVENWLKYAMLNFYILEKPAFEKFKS